MTEDATSRDAHLAEEAREMRTALSTLTSRVEALSLDFQKVNELTAAQQEVDRRSSEAVFEAAQAMGEAKQLEVRMAATEADHKKRWDEEFARKIKLQRKMRLQTVYASLAVLLVSLLVSGIAIWLVYNEGKKSDDRARVECEQRLENSKLSLVSYDRILRDSVTLKTDPVLRGLIQAARSSAERSTHIDCSKDATSGP